MPSKREHASRTRAVTPRDDNFEHIFDTLKGTEGELHEHAY